MNQSQQYNQIGYMEAGWDGQARFSVRLLTHGLTKQSNRTSISPAALDQLALLFSKEMDHESCICFLNRQLHAIPHFSLPRVCQPSSTCCSLPSHCLQSNSFALMLVLLVYD
jgi:hypothetical protein